MRLIPSDAALGDLEEINRFSVARFGQAVAERYLGAFFEAFDQIEQYHAIGAPVVGARLGVRALKCGQHRIYYTLRDDIINVERLLHVARDWPNILR
jgi:toxin ParE1/3/4